MPSYRICLAAFLMAAVPATTTLSLGAEEPGPKAYAIAEIAVTNPAIYKQYVAAVGPIVAQFGGKYLVRAGRIVPLEGSAPTGRFIIIEFPNLAMAQKFEASPQYRAIAHLRLEASRSRLFLAEGAPQ